MAGLLESGVMQPGPTVYAQNQLRKQRGTRGLLEAVGGPMSYAPNPAVAAIGQGLLGARYLTGEADPTEGAKSLSDMTAMAIGSRLPAPLRNIITYHGSPHKFDKFDSSKIGTGEGAQAYGHGLYFAESPKVAGAYQKQLTSGARGWEYDGKLADSLPMEQRNLIESFLDKTKYKGMPEAEALAALKADAVSGLAQAEKKLQEARANLGKTLDMGKEWGNLQFFTYGPEHIASAEKSLEQMRRHLAEVEKLKPGAIKANEGALYKVDLPDSAVAKMLDWDKPLSQQAPEVQEALRTSWMAHPDTHAKFTGQQIYEMNGVSLQGKEGTQGAAERLRAAGIPGVRYLDGGSRGGNFDQWIVTSPSGMARQFATEAEAKKAAEYVGGTIMAPKATRNYVVFPGEEGLLNILERNGQPLLGR